MEVSANNSKQYLSLISATFIVSALGYFVDVYDLVLFSIVRVQSLKAIGITDENILDVGMYLINWQMAGLLIGGIISGMLGDKRGRVSALMASILLYSLANIANAFVTNVEFYAALRFLSGLGLAGEVGAAVTLVSEVLKPARRGVGTAVLTAIGILGAVTAGFVGEWISWKTAYLTGGGLGLLLLFLRISVKESTLFVKIKEQTIRKGDFRSLFSSKEAIKRYIYCILVGVPIWFVIGILMTFAPELAKHLGVAEPITSSYAIFYCYVGLCVGDVSSGLLSQLLKKRRPFIFTFLILMVILVSVYVTSTHITVFYFYVLCTALGFSSGYWAAFITLAAESFGTNVRVMAVGTITNFVRGSVLVMTVAVEILQSYYSFSFSVWIVGVIVIALSLISLLKLKETFGRDLEFVQ